MPGHPPPNRLLVTAIALLWPALGACAGAVTIEHALGVTRIPEPPERVISLYQGATDTAVALGLEPVGVVESWTEKPVYRYLRGQLTDTHMLGLETQPDLERIAWLHPDLIVGARNRHRAIYPLLEQMAPTVIADDVYDFKGLLTMMARATGRAQQGEDLLACWRARVRGFRTRISDKLGSRWPPEVAILSFRADHARIYYGGFARTVLDELGFAAPAAHRSDNWGIKLTSQESIPAMDADAIFVFMADDPAVQRTYRNWTSHPLWHALRAVRQEEVHIVDPVIWNMGAGILAAHRMLDDLYRHYRLTDSETCAP